MGGGQSTRGDGTRLFAAGLVAAFVLLVLGTAAAAAHGGRAPAAPPPPTPVLARLVAPAPLPPPEPPTTAAPRVTKRVVRKASPTTTAAPTTTTSTTQPPAPLPTPGPGIPQGKGVWVWEPARSDGGNVVQMVNRAKGVGLSHIFVRTGSSWDGFNGGPFLAQLLPVAHAAGLKVYGWDFPKLEDVDADVKRGLAAIDFSTAHGDRIDGFAADIETPSEGTRLTVHAVQLYGSVLRGRAGPKELLIAAVPRPSQQMLARYPYADVVAPFDAIAPMIYWLNREPGGDTADAMVYLDRFHKPLLPIGQAYDGGPEGGRPGVPRRAELLRFMEVAKQYDAAAVSFWSWQAANGEAWDAIRDGANFLRPPPAEKKPSDG